jgi:hypothetical protein
VSQPQLAIRPVDAVAPLRMAWLQPCVVLLVAAAALAAGFLATDRAASAQAVAQAGPELVRLLRAMAAIKALMAIAAGAAVLWRLGSAATPPWLAGYALACGAMAAAPGLIWDMAHVTLGAALLHGGLLACIVLLWRDPAVGSRLAALVQVRRRRMADKKSALRETP